MKAKSKQRMKAAMALNMNEKMWININNISNGEKQKRNGKSENMKTCEICGHMKIWWE